MLTVACVWTGKKYGPEYVKNLRNMVHKNLEPPFRFMCLTDNKPREVFAGVEFVDISSTGLNGWWAKMALFNPDYRGEGRTIYFDLDTVICGDLSPLAFLDGGFAICENFTRLAGNKKWPCGFGSCVMVFPEGWGRDIWDRFRKNQGRIVSECPRGDQQAIEKLVPDAVLLQGELPKGYLVGRRDFTDEKPKGAAVMIFAGRHNPDNTPHKWLRRIWEGKK